MLAAALAAVADPTTKPDVLLAKGRAALALKIERAGAARAVAAAGRAARRPPGRADDAVAVLGPPPHGDDAIGRYIAFKQMEAHARASRRGPLLAEAREVLARRAHADVEKDPASMAIMDIALRTLLASPVSDETLEVLESLGPPRERLGRAEAFAQAALEAGAFRSAMATFLWLHENDNDPNRQLQNLARASVAAARAGDRAEFARTFRLLAGQEDRLTSDGRRQEARARRATRRPTRRASATGQSGTGRTRASQAGQGGQGRTRTTARQAAARRRADRLRRDATAPGRRRRAARSVNWQRALLVVARDALPALVENDDQPNLATLVDTLKRHLGDGGRGPVDEELTTLYRAASAHLKTGARAYAETVGAERRPILLGDVLIGRKYDVPAPLIDLSAALDEVGTLVFVPRRGNDASAASIAKVARPPGRGLDREQIMTARRASIWPASASPRRSRARCRCTAREARAYTLHRRDPGGSLRARAFVRSPGRSPRPSRRAAPAASRRSSAAWPRSDARRWPPSRTPATLRCRNGWSAPSPPASSIRWRSSCSAAAASSTTARRFSWNVLRNLELAARVGPAPDELRGSELRATGADCTRTTWAPACAGSWATGTSARSSGRRSRRRTPR